MYIFSGGSFSDFQTVKCPKYNHVISTMGYLLYLPSGQQLFWLWEKIVVASVYVQSCRIFFAYYSWLWTERPLCCSIFFPFPRFIQFVTNQIFIYLTLLLNRDKIVVYNVQYSTQLKKMAVLKRNVTLYMTIIFVRQVEAGC